MDISIQLNKIPTENLFHLYIMFSVCLLLELILFQYHQSIKSHFVLHRRITQNIHTNPFIFILYRYILLFFTFSQLLMLITRRLYPDSSHIPYTKSQSTNIQIVLGKRRKFIVIRQQVPIVHKY